MDYFALKNSHIALAIVSVILFLIRAGASINRSRKPSKAFRVFAHLVDTLLLGLGVYLAYMLSINPFQTPWLAVKLVAIVAYIGCGTLVMKGKSRRTKEFAMMLSLILIAYIFMLAMSKNPFDVRIF